MKDEEKNGKCSQHTHTHNQDSSDQPTTYISRATSHGYPRHTKHLSVSIRYLPVEQTQIQSGTNKHVDSPIAIRLSPLTCTWNINMLCGVCQHWSSSLFFVYFASVAIYFSILPHPQTHTHKYSIQSSFALPFILLIQLIWNACSCIFVRYLIYSLLIILSNVHFGFGMRSLIKPEMTNILWLVDCCLFFLRFFILTLYLVCYLLIFAAGFHWVEFLHLIAI